MTFFRLLSHCIFSPLRQSDRQRTSRTSHCSSKRNKTENIRLREGVAQVNLFKLIKQTSTYIHTHSHSITQIHAREHTQEVYVASDMRTVIDEDEDINYSPKNTEIGPHKHEEFID